MSDHEQLLRDAELRLMDAIASRESHDLIAELYRIVTQNRRAYDITVPFKGTKHPFSLNLTDSLIDQFLQSSPYSELFLERKALISNVRPLRDFVKSLGITHQAVSSRVVSAEKAYSKAINDTSNAFDAIRERSDWLRDNLDVVIDIEDTVTRSLIDHATRDTQNTTSAETLLLWLVGPYRYHGGAWVRDKRKYDQIQTFIAKELDNKRYLKVYEIVDISIQLDVSTSAIDTLLASNETYRKYGGDVWGFTHRSLLDQSEVVVSAQQEPMTVAELLAIILPERQYSERSVRQRLSEDSRFVRVNVRGAFGLTEWGMDAWNGIIDAITQVISAAGGKAHRSDILLELVKKGAAKSSIYTYVDKGPFKTDNGWVTMKEDTNHYEAKSPSLRSDTLQLGNFWWQKRCVSAKHLKGFSFLIHMDVAAHNGLKPGNSLVVPVVLDGEIVGEVSQIWRISSMTQSIDVGRLRPILSAHKIEQGAELHMAPTPDQCLIRTSI